MEEISERRKEVIEIIKDIMSFDVTNEDTDLELIKMESWDSFNSLMLIARLQEKYNIEFTALEVETIITLNELYKSIGEKLNETI